MTVEPLALMGGTLYTEPGVRIAGGTVLLRDGRILAAGQAQRVPVPPEFAPIDCSGCTIMAGFWNSHVHFFERKWANAAQLPADELAQQLQDMIVRYGFTSVFDLSSVYENTCALRDRIESEAPGPRIRTTGEGLISPGALPGDHVFAMMGVVKAAMPEVATTEEAVAAAKGLLAKSVDGIKLFLQAGSAGASFPEDLIRAVADVAHAARKPVFAHPTTGEDVRKAVMGGVDVIAHTTPHSGPWDKSLLNEAAKRGTGLTPTLSLWRFFARHDRRSTQDRIAQTAVDQLRDWHAAGADVLFGTDLGAGDYAPAGEYEMMHAAGMGFDAILASLTTVPAKRFGDASREGCAREGYAADLTVVRGDPSADIRALAARAYTIRGGRILFQ